MIAIGQPLCLMPLTDRWGRPDGGVEASSYGWIHPDLWVRVQAFQAPYNDDVGPGETFKEASERVTTQMMHSGQICTIWQMNIAAPDQCGAVRTYAILGVERLVQWSWVDIHVRLPILKLRAAIHNRLHRREPE